MWYGWTYLIWHLAPTKSQLLSDDSRQGDWNYMGGKVEEMIFANIYKEHPMKSMKSNAPNEFLDFGRPKNDVRTRTGVVRQLVSFVHLKAAHAASKRQLADPWGRRIWNDSKSTKLEFENFKEFRIRNLHRTVSTLKTDSHLKTIRIVVWRDWDTPSVILFNKNQPAAMNLQECNNSIAN